mgnify:CR=1 FL=1
MVDLCPTGRKVRKPKNVCVVRILNNSKHPLFLNNSKLEVTFNKYQALVVTRLTYSIVSPITVKIFF